MYGFTLGPQEDEYFGKFQVRNSGNEKYKMEKNNHGSKSKCELMHKEGQLCILGNGNQTAEYNCIHAGTKYCTQGASSGNHLGPAVELGYFSQDPHCSGK